MEENKRLIFLLFLYRRLILVRKKNARAGRDFFDIVFINPNMIIYGYCGLNLCLISWVLQRLECKQSPLQIGPKMTFYDSRSETMRSGREPGST